MVAQELREKIMGLFDGPTLSALATVNKRGRPWTRFVMSDIDENMILHIPTIRETRKVEEIQAFPFVHVLVGKDLFTRDGGYAQIEGRAILSQDAGYRPRFRNPQLRRLLTDPNDPAYVLIEVYPERIEYWSLLQEKNPQVLEKSQIGAYRLIPDEVDWMNDYDAHPCCV